MYAPAHDPPTLESRKKTNTQGKLRPSQTAAADNSNSNRTGSVPVPAPATADHRDRVLPRGREADVHAHRRATSPTHTTHAPHATDAPDTDAGAGDGEGHGLPDGGGADEGGEARDLLARGDEGLFERLVLVLQELDLGLQLREPRLLALAALQRRCGMFFFFVSRRKQGEKERKKRKEDVVNPKRFLEFDNKRLSDFLTIIMK